MVPLDVLRDVEAREAIPEPRFLEFFFRQGVARPGRVSRPVLAASTLACECQHLDDLQIHARVR